MLYLEVTVTRAVCFIAPRQIETKEVIEMDEERPIQIRQWLVQWYFLSFLLLIIFLPSLNLPLL